MKTTKVLSALVIGMMIVSSIPLFATAQATNDELVIALQQDMTSINPWDPDTNDVWKSFQIGWNFEGLMAYNPDYELYPVLAAPSATGPNGADVTITNGGMDISVNIRQGVTFHDGTPMNSTDVVFSYQTLAWGLFQTQTLGPLYWDDGTTFTRYDGMAGGTHIGVETNGTYRVDFHLNGNYAMFWYLTMALPIMPYHIWDAHTIDLVPADYPAYDVTGEKGWDYGYGSDVSETDATIGTGPLMLQSWIKEQGSVIVPYTGYWDTNGTTTWQNVNYPNYPQNVNRIRFKIYTQLDVAILALQNGDVHQLPWSLTPGYYNLLKTDPNIGIELNKDQGFFYMSYNFRKGAMADVNFRRAVAYCVDKQYIVDRLMGGYGIQGSVPMSVTNTFYVNSSVPAWIAGGDLNAAKVVLDAHGYTDKNGDGWRDMPDGSPLKYNILTPPKDYDPIRADAGIMIEKNLKSIGLNIAAVPTSFDTIVSAAYVSLDFDMYILGWTVGSFPESYLRDFFHSDSDVAMNPAGSNAAGYHNATVDTMIEDMETEMDTEARAQLIKDICGATMMDLPYDVLYYRTNIEAYRKDIWSGWIPAFGTIYNGFSVFNLALPEEGGGGGGGSSGGSATLTGIESKINMPSMTGAGEPVSGSIIATDVLDSFGKRITEPSVGATVHIVTSFDQYVNTTTDSNGLASFTLNVPYQKINSFRVDANISRSGAWNNINKTVGVKFTNHIAQFSLSTNDGVIAPGGTTTVTAMVIDENGDPLTGVNVYVDTALMFGTVDAATKATNAAGIAAFTYTAPPVGMLPNTHRFDQFKANCSVPNTIVPEVQSASLIIGISSDLFDWHNLDITNVTNYILDNIGATAFANTTTITLELTDQNGTAVPDFYVSIDLSEGGSVIDADAPMKMTDSNGIVKFNLTVDSAYTGSGTVLATFNTSRGYSIKDSVAIYIRNDPTCTVDTYHINVTSVSHDTIMNTNVTATNTTTVVVRLFNSTWTPVSGMDVWMGMSDMDLVVADAEFNNTDATGYARFNITCVANGSADLAITFGVEDSIGISQGYNLKVNKTMAGIPILNEHVFGPAVGGETGLIGTLTNTPVLDAQVYLANGVADGVLITPGVDYNLNPATGDITILFELLAGDHIYAHYNYTVPYLSELVFGPAVGGETGLIGTLTNTPVLDAQVYLANGAADGVLITPGVDYNLNPATGDITMLYELSAGDHIYAAYHYAVPYMSELVFGPSMENSRYWHDLAQTPVFNATVKTWNAGTWTDLIAGTDYSIDMITGNISYINKLATGDSVYTWYNYSNYYYEYVYGPATGGETGWINFLSYTPILNSNVLVENTGVWTQLTEPADYTIDPATGDLTLNIVLAAGDNVWAHYNYSIAVANETIFAGPAVAGETGLIGSLVNTPIADANILLENTGVWTQLNSPADYTLNLVNGQLTLNIVLVAGDNIYAHYNYTTNHVFTVTNVSSYYIDMNTFGDATPGYSNVVVRLTDSIGNPMVGKTVTAIPWGKIGVVNPYNITNATGYAFFNITSTSDISGSQVVYFQVNDTAGWTESITFFNPEYIPGYAADINFTGIADHNSEVDITAIVYDAAGNPAQGVPCQFFIPPTPEGIPGVFQNGDDWYWEEYGTFFNLADYAGYLGSWLGNYTMFGPTVTDVNGEFAGTIDTASFIADAVIPLQFGVGGYGVAEAFNFSANQFWMEYYPDYAPPLADNADVYYWEPATFTVIDQAILLRAPMATLTEVTIDQSFLSAADNATTISLTFQDLAGPLDTITVNIGEGTASPDILDEGDTSTAGVYTYNYTAAAGDFDSGIGFTTILTDPNYAKYPFNFYLPYLADGTTAKTLVVSVVPADPVVTMGDDITLDMTVKDEYGRLVSGVAVVSGTHSDTTDANGVAQLAIPTEYQADTGIFEVLVNATKGTLGTHESTYVNLKGLPILSLGTYNVPENITLDVEFTVTVDATNVGNQAGDLDVPFVINGTTHYVTTTLAVNETKTVSFPWTFTEPGTYDICGVSRTVEPIEEEEGGLNMMLIAAIIIVIVVVIVVLVLVLPKMKGGKPAEPAEKEAEPAEESMEQPEPDAPEEPTTPEELGTEQ